MTNRLATRLDATREDEGFTLIELLTVIVIIGLLAIVATSTFLNQRTRAEKATAVSDLRNAATAEEAQLLDGGTYSTSLTALSTNGFRRSPDTKLGIGVSTGGYCAVAGNGGQYYWFDSLAGGLQGGSTSGLTPPATASGVCRTNAPTVLS